LLTVAAAGCGGGTTTVTVTGDTTGGGSASAEELQEQVENELEAEEAAENGEGQAADGDCEEKGIDGPERKEGTCFAEGTKWVVADMHSPLKLETLEARLTGLQERKTISSEFESTTANGVFVTFDLTITNLTHAPQEFEEAQAVLFVDESVYTQDFEVQNGSEERSFLWEEGPIQPQEPFEGTVTFDIPRKIAKKITAEGNLDIANFGAEYYEPEAFFEEEEIGTIRTYQ